ncbi:endothelin-converting enzyme 2-like [Ornithodoros turicata]|uniref:endothelin-converting enzyme 2-like n=1 Tax=Ornithodoros turicata TaxID=34597 RepID=UPI00313A2CED
MSQATDLDLFAINTDRSLHDQTPNEDFGNIIASCLLLASVFSVLLAGSLLFYKLLSSEASDTSDSQYCRTEDCKLIGWMYSKYIGRGDNPCNNFYQYVCQGFEVSVLGAMATNLSRNIYEAFIELKTPRKNQTAPQKAASFYQQCLVAARVAKKENGNLLATFFRDLKLSFEVLQTTDPIDTLVLLGMRYDLHIFFSFALKKLTLIADDYLFLVKESALFEAWRKRRASYLRVQGRYSEYVQNVLDGIDITEKTELDNVTSRIRSVEDEVIKVRSQNDGKHNYITVRLSSFLTDPALLPRWDAALEKHTTYVLPSNYSVSSEEQMYTFLNNIFAIDTSRLSTYITWEAARQLSVLSGMVADPDVVFNSNYCYAMTLRLFKHAVVSPYLISVIDHPKLDAVSNIITDIWDSASQRMAESSWLDNSTKTALLRKLHRLKFVVGYPTGMSTALGLELLYSDYPDMTGPYLSALLKASHAYSRSLLKHIHAFPDDLVAADFNYDSVGAYYIRGNYVYIQAGLLLPPAYVHGAPPEINYGGLGHAIAHEMMRAFDDSSRKVDEYGNEIAWSAESDKAFKDKMECLNSSSIIATPRRQRVLRDDYEPDALAVKSLYEAYRMASDDSSLRIEGLERYTSDQLFFISSCYFYCLGRAERRISRPARPHRCNVPLANSAQFATAFNCAPGTPMNPTTKCEIW